MRRLRRLLGSLVVLALLAGAGVVFGYWYLDRWLATPSASTAPVIVTLPRGAGVAVIGRRLAEAGVIDEPRLFRLGARLVGKDMSLKAGEYEIAPGVTPRAVIDLLARGEVLLHPVAVPEGRTVREVFALLAASEVLTGDLPPLPAEGALLPETYFVPRGETRASVVERMRAAMTTALDAAWAGRAPELGLGSPVEALVLASVIEKETAKPEEYPLVASVMVNRLRRGMKLQTDPSVIYGLTAGEGALGRALTTADLQQPHPWNTYVIPALPPSPITNPGRAALDAAVRPADTGFLYFVADGTGGHVFATSLAEHNRNVARWRRLRREKAGG